MTRDELHAIANAASTEPEIARMFVASILTTIHRGDEYVLGAVAHLLRLDEREVPNA